MRLLRRRLRLALVLMLCLSLSVDPASACHWLAGRWMNRCAPSAYACAPVSYAAPSYSSCGSTGYGSSCGSYASYSSASSCSQAMDCCGGGWSAGMATSIESSGCGCDGSVVSEYSSGTIIHEGIHEGTVMESTTGTTPSTGPTPTWAGAEPATDRAVNKPSEPELLPENLPPAPELADDVSPADTMPQPADDFSAPADDLFAAPPADAATDDNDLFDAPADEPAAANDDRFAAPAEEPAMAEPTVDQPADDLFGAPADEPAMAEPAAANDDLFGAPADEPAASDDDLFGAPAAEPAREEPAATNDDLFGAPPRTLRIVTTCSVLPPSRRTICLAHPAEEPVMEAPASDEPAAAEDDLFGLPVEETPASDTDDLFGAPAGNDDLFGAPAEEAAPADNSTTEADDLFGDFGAVLELPGGLSSLALRHWVDSTGQYTVDARLVAVIDGHVRLLKANGRTTTVSFSRLSDEDLSFVNRQAAAEQAQVLSQTAQL